jgi:hypothetical protein
LFRTWASKFTESFDEFVSHPPVRTSEAVYYNSGGEGGSVGVTYVENTDADVLALLKLPDTVWNEAFPMIVGFGKDRPVFLVLDSIMKGTNIVTNAFGELNKRQLVLCEALIKDNPKLRVILSLHHHLGNPKEGLPKFQDRLLDRGLTIRNPEDLVKALPASRSFVVFNGHRHIAYTGVIDKRITAISGPSATLGNSGVPRETRKPRIGMYELMWDEKDSFTHFHERWLE